MLCKNRGQPFQNQFHRHTSYFCEFHKLVILLILQCVQIKGDISITSKRILDFFGASETSRLGLQLLPNMCYINNRGQPFQNQFHRHTLIFL